MIAAEPVAPPVVAVIVAGPLPLAVTTPDEFTVAHAWSEDDHVKVLPEIACPLASRAVAVNCDVWPRDEKVADGGVTSTDATLGGRGSVALSPQARSAAPTRVTDSILRDPGTVSTL
jgi:hypothetical protein